ncbi:30S ribosomal protein S20 [Patescibacteria group bacterium]|nr:30S ribosomal protein S20 [Patescibacteria group bacterium]MBU4000157.1 30S ribosomal protein S20 [Patescibacteria group bacterium]MBU4056975.1 30S ribosomal protein S20 [Patescibacteria group bacterium]MBU4368868.1 30S ribosomal protein S20 [Patescibacteria group bacterium]
MPITKSAQKALRQNIKRRLQNAAAKNKVRTLAKKLKKAVAEKNAEEAKKTLVLATKTIDKAVKTGVLKKNTASRKKSNLAKLVNALLK